MKGGTNSVVARPGGTVKAMAGSVHGLRVAGQAMDRAPGWRVGRGLAAYEAGLQAGPCSEITTVACT